MCVYVWCIVAFHFIFSLPMAWAKGPSLPSCRSTSRLADGAQLVYLLRV